MTQPLSIAFNLPFSEAIAAAQQRGAVLPEVYYGQLQGIARQLAFTVSGLAGLEQIQQVKDSLDKALESGQSFNAWKKSVDAMGFGLPKHRLDNIFRTNLQGQYMAGKWEQFERNKANRPYVMYDAINDSRVRPAHLALDGKIWRIDDPQLHTHSPPNGYRCRCSLISLSESQAQARSKDGKGLNKPTVLPDGITPANPDKGWDYSPRNRLVGVKKAIADRRNQCGGLNFSAVTLAKKRHNPPIWCNEKQYAGIFMQSLNGFLQANGVMPKPRIIQGVERLSDKLDEAALFERFISEFSQAEIDDGLKDIIGNVLLIDRSLFTDLKGKWKIMKDDRAQWLLYTAVNIKTPDEIWLEKSAHGGVDKLYYLSRFVVNSRDILSTIAVFERKQSDTGIWTGRTNFATTRDDGYIESKRGKGTEGLKYWRWDR